MATYTPIPLGPVQQAPQQNPVGQLYWPGMENVMQGMNVAPQNFVMQAAQNPNTFNLSGEPQGFDWSGMWDKALGYTDAKGVKHNGFAAPALDALSGLASSWLGMQQLDLAKDQFAFQKDSWAKNWEMNKNMVNSQLADRQNARLAAAPGSYQSVGDYMNQYGVK